MHTTHDAPRIRDNFLAVRQIVDDAARRAGRDPAGVRIVAVSKRHPSWAVAALAEAGHLDFGENYAQEALAKQDELADLALRWHFIGHLQSNKAKQIAGRFAMVHGVDSTKLAQALANKALALGAVQDVLVQANLAAEAQKSGCAEDELPALCETIARTEGLRLRGLMLMPPFFDEPERARPWFAQLRQARDALQTRLGLPLPELSMGMSGDYVAAVEEGATLVRVGTAIFGTRN